MSALDVLPGLATDAGRAYQENVRLYGEVLAKQMHEASNARIAAVAELIEAAGNIAFAMRDGAVFNRDHAAARLDAARLRCMAVQA